MPKIISLQPAIELISELEADHSIPRNIRTILEDIKKILNSGQEQAISINAALHKLEDLSLDPNLDSLTRTQILNLTCLLEDSHLSE